MAADDPKTFEEVALDSTYADPTQVFSFRPRSLDKAKNSAVVVLDTQALLVPYGTGKAILDEIRGTFGRLKKEKRLVVPGQVAREFAKNRPEKLKTLYSQLFRRQQINLPENLSYPLLAASSLFQKVQAAHTEVESKVREYRHAVGEMLKELETWRWDDAVSALYSDLFDADIIVELLHDAEETTSEWSHRLANKIPPGYKDGGKPDTGIGDFLIWKTVLQVGRSKGADVIFVSGDEKTDWRHQSEGRALWPRFELIEEFRRETDGRTLHMIRLAGLLELFGAEPALVEEVRREEAVTPAGRSFWSPSSMFVVSPRPTEQAFKAVVNHLSESGVVVRRQDGFPDLVSDNGQSYVVLDHHGAGVAVGPLLQMLSHIDLAVSSAGSPAPDMTVFVIVPRLNAELLSGMVRRINFPNITTQFVELLDDGRLAILDLVPAV